MTRRTVLGPEHERLGATFTDFGGWDMPLKYGSELAEHRAVRESAGLFDLSHMGEIRVQGADAAVFLNTALAGNLAVMAVGRAKYSLILDEHGGLIDDLITYRLGPEEFLVVPNAGNAETVFSEFKRRAKGFEVSLANETAQTALIAVQGPNAASILTGLVPAEQQDLIAELKYYAAAEATVAGINVLLARTGYTGEDGFELYLPNEDAVALWNELLNVGEPHDLVPAGLASRDSLRLEAGMPLYGNELSTSVTPSEAGLGPVVSFKKEERFIGRDALEGTRESTPGRVLVGLKGEGRRAGRAGYAVLADGVTVGEITSGLPSPTLGYPIALAYVAPEHSEVGTKLDVDLRGKPHPFEVIATPFYTRQK